MKNKKRLIVFILTTIVFIVAAIATVLIPKIKVYKSKASEAGGITLSLSPSINLRINQSQRVDIKAEGNKDIDGFSIVLLFNSTYLDVSDIKINAPFEQLVNKIETVTTSMKKITIAGILPPGMVSPTLTGPFILGSFLVKGIAPYNGLIDIPFATTDPRFQIAKGGSNILPVNSTPLKICVQSSYPSCPPISNICGEKPDPAIIKYPLAVSVLNTNNEPMITTDSKVVAYFEIPNDGCPTPKQYKASIFDGTVERCSTDWLSSTTAGVKVENASFKNGSNCGSLSEIKNYTLKVNIRSGGASGTISDAIREFKYDSSKSVPDYTPKGFGYYGNTDITVPFSFHRNGRDDNFVNNYVRNGSVSDTWDIVLMPHYTYYAAGVHNTLEYTARKTKEMAINFPSQIRGIGADDAYGLGFSTGYTTLSAFRNDALGDGRLVLTLYDGNYKIGSSDTDNNSGVKLAIFFYTHDKSLKYEDSFKTVKDYWTGKGANVIMYAGLYPRVMKGFHTSETWEASFSEDITNSCKNAKAAYELYTNGINGLFARGIEIYDQSPLNCDVISPTPFPTPLFGSDGKEQYKYTSHMCYIDKFIAVMTSRILNNSGSIDCTNLNSYCKQQPGLTDGADCPP